MVPRLIRTYRIQWWCSPFLFILETPFLGKFCPKTQNFHFTLKFGTYTNLNMQKSMAVFTFSVLDWKYPFWPNLVPDIKIFSFSWSFVLRVIRICTIQCWCSLFLFSARNTFSWQIWSKKSKFSVQVEIWLLDWFSCAEFSGGAHFLCFWLEIPYLGKCSKNSKLSL